MPSPRKPTPAQKTRAKKPAKKARPERRAPLGRDRVLDAAMTLADARGLEALSMRELARALGVEAMSLYKHVSSKDALLDGLAERVRSEMSVPEPTLDWRAALRGQAISSRGVLLRHPWAALLIGSRALPGPARLRSHDATLGALRRAGFPVELAYRAYLTLDSYVSGFVQQELSWPFEPDERPELLESLAPRVSRRTHPHLVEVMRFVDEQMSARPAGETRELAYAAEFEFGLDLLLDGLEKARRAARSADALEKRRGRSHEPEGVRSLALWDERVLGGAEGRSEPARGAPSIAELSPKRPHGSQPRPLEQARERPGR